jgi:hypothetical protein
MFGTVWQAGVGVGVGAGVGVGGGVGAGVAVGGGVTWGVGVGAAVGFAVGGAGVAPGGRVGVAAARDVGAGALIGCCAESVDVGWLAAGVVGVVGVAPSGLAVSAGADTPSDAGADGLSVASRTPCPRSGWNGFPRITASAAMSRTATPMPAGTR